MGPDRHVGMRLSACSTKRRIPGFASGMWPHTVSMRPHARRDAWNSPRGRAPGATPKSRHARENLSLRFTVPLLFSTSKTTRTTKRKTRYRVASFCFINCGTETLGVFSCANFDHKNHPKRTRATVICLEPQGLVCAQTNGPQAQFWESTQHKTPL